MDKLRSFRLGTRFYYFIIVLIIIFIIAYFFKFLYIPALIGVSALLVMLLFDLFKLYGTKGVLLVSRETPLRLSNGDDNIIRIKIVNTYNYDLKVEVIDEIPVQFQKRDFSVVVTLKAGEQKEFHYSLRPVSRGEYTYGRVHLFASGPLALVIRRFTGDQPVTIPVYPSFLQFKQYEIAVASNTLTELGIKRIRRIGHATEFEQIRDYTPGDDFRTINWKASARKNTIMVNNYEDEKAQQLYCVINTGRVMKMPFNGLSLVDYAINSSLMLSHIAIKKMDKTGIVTFADKVEYLLPADNKTGQMQRILELLYNQTTSFNEADFEALCARLLKKIPHRSLIMLFNNFETMEGMQRQLPYLKKLSARHVVCVVFFHNSELQQLTRQPATSIETIYDKTIAEKFIFDKKRIVKALNQHRIYTVLTEPENVTINTVNKYLEFKARNII